MKPNIFQSRRFWTLVLDFVISIVGFITAHYVSPSTAELIKFLVVTIQPIAIFLIGAYTVTDVAYIRSNTPK